MIKRKPDMKKLEQTLVEKVKVGVEKAVTLLKDNIDSITPEDTKTLLGNNTVEITINGGVIEGKVFNDTSYAMYVEYGVSGKSYQYHKPKGVPFYKGIGNRTFARGIDMTKPKALQLLKQALG